MTIAAETIPEILIGSVQRAPWGWALLGTIIIALIKVWPIMNAQVIATKDRIQDRKERKENDALTDKTADLSDCKKELAATNERLDGAIERIHQLELKLVGTVGAYRILEDEITRDNPASQGLANARVIFRNIWDVTAIVPPAMAETIAKVQ